MEKQEVCCVRDTRMMMSEPSLYILDMYCGPTEEGGKRRSYVKDFVK